MKLFSKRNVIGSIPSVDERRVITSLRARRTELVSSEIRNRLIAEIKFLSSSNDFLEWFILFENEKKERIFFDENKVNSFSLAELGYAASDHFQFDDFKMIEIERKIRYSSETDRTETYFDDYRLFDLCEITILFSKKAQRLNVINRFNSILAEENAGFLIIEQLITRKDGDHLKGLVSLIKDDRLREKIKAYYAFEANKDAINAAKISADILNIIFSGLIVDGKKSAIATLKKRLVECLVGEEKGSNTKQVRLDKHIDSLLQTSKNLSNDIYDIRHTEQSTIQVSNKNIYKLVANHNISIAELVLTTLKADYVFSSNWEAVKQEYISKYKIDPTTRLTIKKPLLSSTTIEDIGDEPIDLDDIPF